MAEIKTKATKVGVKDFIAKVPNETRRKDAETLLKLFRKVTGWKAQMWGPTIVGFGKYDYTYDSGHSGSICVVGFSPRASSLSIYSGIYAGKPEAEPHLKGLGKYKTGKGCLYINKLEDVDMKVFEKLITSGVANMKKEAKAKGWTISAT
ncbi:MAG TPA: DUF1801 domain-containing protein [Hyphomonadaceae bacterium]|jgi:hypothetical protein|nr:DUF1801 domain-containing protein [Hyphomonadaceae bacterium]